VWISLDPECNIQGNRAANSFYEAYEGENASANPGEPGAVRRFFQDGRELAAGDLPMQKAAATGQPVVDCELEVVMPSGITGMLTTNSIRRAGGSVGRWRCSSTLPNGSRRRNRRLQAVAPRRRRTGSLSRIQRHHQWVNDAFTRLTGYGAAEAVGNNPRVLKSGEHDAKFYKNLWETILSGRVWQGEMVNKRKDGRLYNEEMTITPVRDAGGAISRFIAIKQDITARKRAEEELRHANARIQKLLSANVIGIAEFDATKIVSANRALLDMTGYGARDVARGRVDWREITPPEYAERDNRAWREMMEHGECLPYEKEYITRNGKRVPILIAGVKLTEDPVTGVFLNLDITDWKLMERELLETTHFAEHLFDSSLIGLTRSDNEGLLDANDAFLEMVGYTREDFEAGLIDRQVMTPDEYAALDKRAIDEMLATGEAAPFEKEYIRKDGSRVPVLVGRKLVRESPREWVAFVLDIAERKRAEEDLDRVRTEFLGEVSHELKTPLTAIKGCASMALSSVTPPNQAEARELFEVVDTQANRLTDLVGNLLDMTRIEGGRLSIEPAEVDIGGIIEEARVIFEHSRYPHPLKIELPPKLPRVRADSRRIVQVLTNLYSNAAKFSSPQTHIVVSAEKAGGEVILHVRDSGMGIPSGKMPLLFQKFTQVHTMGAKGTGLGLFICKGIIEAQGGRIWADSAGEGRGATFSFALLQRQTKRAPRRRGPERAGGRR
jgi:PAS domain S-box-containing protein